MSDLVVGRIEFGPSRPETRDEFEGRFHRMGCLKCRQIVYIENGEPDNCYACGEALKTVDECNKAIRAEYFAKNGGGNA
jgi:hypothetical protein